jgi:hypothetical protein
LHEEFCLSMNSRIRVLHPSSCTLFFWNSYQIL